MNVFSTARFLEIAGEVHFPHARRSVELFEVDGRVLRLLVVNGRPVRSMLFYDFPQPLDVVPAGARVTPLPYFPLTVQRTERIEARTGPEPRGVQPSPYIDWTSLPSFAAWEAHARARTVVKSGDDGRQRRRLERDVGPVRFEADDKNVAVFDAVVRWKAAQYRASGFFDGFSVPANVELFRRLHAAGLVLVSSLWAGDTLLAGHLGASHERRLAWWVPAYDAQFGKYSPGRLLLKDLIAWSHARGDVEFDFLIGAEDYKFIFATHNRVIGPVGVMPMRERLVRDARWKAREALSHFPRVEAAARELKRTVTSFRR